MAGFRFFKTPNPQRFDYKPRFYDPEKEELMERVRNAEQQEEYDAESVKSRISGGFRRKTGGYATDRQFRSQQVKRSNFRLLIIVAFLFLMGYVLFSSNLTSLKQILESISGY
ncbi:MAG: hypothetical protein AAFO82_01115 [Bacteroidota bacterium]